MRPIDADELLKIIDKAEDTWGQHKYFNYDGIRYLISLCPTIEKKDELKK